MKTKYYEAVPVDFINPKNLPERSGLYHVILDDGEVGVSAFDNVSHLEFNNADVKFWLRELASHSVSTEVKKYDLPGNEETLNAFDNMLDAGNKLIENLKSKNPVSTVGEDAEMQLCECGHTVPLEFTVSDDEGCYTCMPCHIKYLNEDVTPVSTVSDKEIEDESLERIDSRPQISPEELALAETQQDYFIAGAKWMRSRLFSDRQEILKMIEEMKDKLSKAVKEKKLTNVEAFANATISNYQLLRSVISGKEERK